MQKDSLYTIYAKIENAIELLVEVLKKLAEDDHKASMDRPKRVNGIMTDLSLLVRYLHDIGVDMARTADLEDDIYDLSCLATCPGMPISRIETSVEHIRTDLIDIRDRIVTVEDIIVSGVNSIIVRHCNILRINTSDCFTRNTPVFSPVSSCYTC